MRAGIFLGGVFLPVRQDDAEPPRFARGFESGSRQGAADGVVERGPMVGAIGFHVEVPHGRDGHVAVAHFGPVRIKQGQGETGFRQFPPQRRDVLIEAGDGGAFAGLHGAAFVEDQGDVEQLGVSVRASVGLVVHSAILLLK